MAEPAGNLHMTPAEWRDWEERQAERYELIGDEPTLMAGGTARHNDISLNIVTALRERLRGGPCRAYMADMKAVHPSGRWSYPDVVVRCGERLDRETGIEDAIVAVEVLSPRTGNYDLDSKRWFYVELPSLRHVVFVAQDRPWVEVYSRVEDGTWRSVFLTDQAHEAHLDAIGVMLPLAAIYDEIAFTSSGAA